MRGIPVNGAVANGILLVVAGLVVTGVGVVKSRDHTTPLAGAPLVSADPVPPPTPTAPRKTPKASPADREAVSGARIGVSTIQYDSPGGTVPAIVTVYHSPGVSDVSITASGTNGSTATCPGPVWHNPVQNTTSRTCYLQLPNHAGNYTVQGSATLSKGSATRTVTGSAQRPIAADGKPSPTPMTPADIDRIERCGNTTKDVWLTFDDGGSNAQVTSILTTLKRNNVQAHFFFRGDWARKNPALMAKIRSAGHVIGNHTSTHRLLSRDGETKVLDQIDNGTRASGDPMLLRPPFGAGAFSTRLRQIAGNDGYQLCRWTTDTYDWEGASTQVMVQRITYGDSLSAPIGAGGVLLMHGHAKHTAPGLQQIIDAVRAKHLSLPPLR